MSDILFEGRKHKITTDGKTFFFYTKSAESKWKLRDSNSFDSGIYAEALKDMKKLLSMKIPEDEKVLKMLESGFFSISSL